MAVLPSKPARLGRILDRKLSSNFPGLSLPLGGAAGNVATVMPASRSVTITALGVAQILGWGTSFYFPAVLAPPISADTGWPLSWVVSGTSIGFWSRD